MRDVEFATRLIGGGIGISISAAILVSAAYYTLGRELQSATVHSRVHLNSCSGYLRSCIVRCSAVRVGYRRYTYRVYIRCDIFHRGDS